MWLGAPFSSLSASIEAKCAIFNFGTNYSPYFLVSETGAIVVRINYDNGVLVVVVVAAILSTFFEAVAILILGGRTAMMIDHGLEGAFLLLYLFTTYIDRHTLLTHSILIAYTTHYSTASIEDILNVTTSQCSLEFILI